MIHVPEAFFRHVGAIEDDREQALHRFYSNMGKPGPNEFSCFYHFAGALPVHQVQHVYVCWRGLVQYKAIIVELLHHQPVMLPDYQHPEPRNWIVTTGPVEQPPHPIPQKGFRGFRYTQHLW